MLCVVDLLGIGFWSLYLLLSPPTPIIDSLIPTGGCDANIRSVQGPASLKSWPPAERLKASSNLMAFYDTAFIS